MRFQTLEVRRAAAETQRLARAWNDLADPDARVRQADTFHNRISTLGRWVERTLNEVNDATVGVQLSAVREEVQKASAYVGLAVIAFLSDIVQSIYTTSVRFTGLSMSTSMLLALLISAFGTLSVHYACAAKITDSARPEWTVRWHRWIATFGGVLAAAGILLLLLISSVPPSATRKLLSLALLPVALINAGLPLAAGAWSSLAWWLLGPKRQKRTFDRLQETWLQLQQLEERIVNGPRVSLLPVAAVKPALPSYFLAASVVPRTSNAAKISPTATNAATLIGPNDEGSNGKNKTFPILPILFVTLALAQQANAAGPCTAIKDETTSVDQSDLGTVDEFIVATAKEMTAECTELVVARYSDEAAWTPRQRLIVPKAPAFRDCAKAEPEPRTGFAALYRVLSNVSEADQEDATAKCRTEQRRMAQEFDRSWAVFLGQLREALEVSFPLDDVKTGTWDAIEAFRREKPALLIVITDGIETLRSTLPTMPPAAETTMLMILARSDPEYSDSLADGAAWQRAIPGLEVVLVPELHPTVWSELAAKHGTKR